MTILNVFGDSSVGISDTCGPKTFLTTSFRDLQESPLDKEELLIHVERPPWVEVLEADDE